MNKSTFFEKVGEGLVVGIMVALVLTVCGVIWKEFEDAKNQLNIANQILDTQVNKTNEAFSKFNMEQNDRNKNQDLFNKKQIETNKEILMAIKQIELTIAALSKKASIKYEPTIRKESFDRIEADISYIQKELDNKQLIQEQIQEQLNQYQEQQQLQQKKW